MAEHAYGVLVVHGFTASLDCVCGVEAAVRELGLPTRMPVLRGHGAASPEALRGVSWQDWVADAEAALDDLLTEAERAILFGHSMGGLVALTLAADAGGRTGDPAGGSIDGLILAAPAIHLRSPLAPGRPLSFLRPLIQRLVDKWDMPPTYADAALAGDDTNYAWAPGEAIGQILEFSEVTRRRLPEVRVPMLIMQSRRDSTVAPTSACIVYDRVSTPPEDKRILWFDETEHEMFRDCERTDTIQAVVDCVREHTGLEHDDGAQPM